MQQAKPKRSRPRLTLQNPSRSPAYTAWKRVFIEKDRMFRRGNLLDADVSAPPPGQLYLARWDGTTPAGDADKYVQAGDRVVVFDTEHPYPGPGPLPYETAVIAAEPAPSFFEAPKPGGGTKSVLRVFLDHALAQTYTPSPLDFSSGKSAAVGVISGCDASTNQINGPGPCFYDADLRGVEVPFQDGYVEVLGRREG